jgi:predicted metal-binding protein
MLKSLIQELRQKMEIMKHKMEDSEATMNQFTEINKNYTSEIKIQKRMNSKLKNEIEYSNTKLKEAEMMLEKEKEATESVWDK